MSEPIIMWRVQGNDIQRVECKSVTPKTVLLLTNAWGGGRLKKPRREARRSTWQTYHESWDEARDYLLRQALFRRDSLQVQTDHAENEVRTLQALQPPEDA